MLRDLTPSFFYEARWFAAKNATITKIEIIDTVDTRYQGLELTLGIVRTYLEQDGRRYVQDYFIPRINGAFIDAEVFSEAYGLAISALTMEKAVLQGQKGSFSFHNLGSRSWRVREINGTSNSLLFLEQQVLIKNYRLLVPGVNPELEMYLALAGTKAGRMMPGLLGYVEYNSAAGRTYTLIMLQEGVVNEGTGWQYFLRRGKNYLLSKENRRGKIISEDKAEAFNLGLMTAVFHRHLALVDKEEFVPAPWRQEQAEAWMGRVTDQLGEIWPDVMRRPKNHKFSRITMLGKELSKMYSFWGKLQRCHGDYHLEQVLRTPQGFLVIDLEGEPLLGELERKRKQSLCKDLAGIIRSFSYVAAVAAKEMAMEWGRAGIWADFKKQVVPWQEAVKEAFLEGYLSENKDDASLPASILFRKLLKFFILEKAMYELDYERRHRPDMVQIPQEGIKQAVRGLLNE